MTMRTLKVLAIVVGVAGAGFGGMAVAGMKATAETVLIYGSGLRCHGSLAAARNSANAIEYIGCKVVGTTSGASVLCEAQDSAGTQFSCNSTNSNIVAAARAISGDSFLTINRDSTDQCTLLYVDNSSVHEPKD